MLWELKRSVPMAWDTSLEYQQYMFSQKQEHYQNFKFKNLDSSCAFVYMHIYEITIYIKSLDYSMKFVCVCVFMLKGLIFLV